MADDNPLRDFENKFKQSKIDPVRQLAMRLDLLEEIMSQLRDEVTLLRLSVREHLTEHEQSDDTQETKDLIGQLLKKLTILQKQEAQYNAGQVPVHIALDIEKTERRISELQQELMNR